MNSMEECEHCGGTGVVIVGEFDDLTEKKCVCQVDDEDHEETEN